MVTSSSAPQPMHSALRARFGISLFFFTNGAVFAGMVARYPEIKHRLGMSDGAFGLTVVVFSIGAMSATILPSLFIRRLGARATSLWWTAALALAMGVAGVAANAGYTRLFMVALFLGGVCDAIVDTAQNSHAMRVQEACGRSIINSLHALWSVGSVAGGAVGALAATHGVPLAVHLPAMSAVCFGLAALADPDCAVGVDGQRAVGGIGLDCAVGQDEGEASELLGERRRQGLAVRVEVHRTSFLSLFRCLYHRTVERRCQAAAACSMSHFHGCSRAPGKCIFHGCSRASRAPTSVMYPTL